MMSRSIGTRGDVLALAIACCFLGSCNSIARNIEVADDDFFTPALRASYDLEGTHGAEGESPTNWTKIMTIEAEVAHGSGDDSQQLNGADFISFQGTDFNGPLTVASDFDLTVASLTARIGGNYREKMSIAGLIGLGYSKLDLELSAPPLVARDTSSDVGIMLGMQLDWHTLAWLDLSLRVGSLLAGDTRLMTNELALRAWPTEQLGVFVGWRYFLYEEEHSGASDVELDLAGPTAGVQFSF